MTDCEGLWAGLWASEIELHGKGLCAIIMRMSEGVFDTIEGRFIHIWSRIEAACVRAERDAADVQLVAVSKTFPPACIDEALRAGVSILGENRVQDALAKAPLCGSAEWHMVGRLQRNKVRAALGLFSAIHSVDSIQLLEEIARIQEETGHRPDVFLEVNVAGEASKTGFTPESVRDAVRAVLSLGCIRLVGLMALPPWRPEPEQSRPCFKALRELAVSLSDAFGVPLPELSMGMSGDFEVAVEEGATFVRVGTALFGKRSSWKPQRSLDTDNYV